MNALELADKIDAEITRTVMLDTLHHDVAAELRRLHTENANLRTVMIAAAEEIADHWDAHCDAEGYGPVNLLRRLENGFASEYGYTAGAFGKLLEENAALRAAVEKECDTLRTQLAEAQADAAKYRNALVGMMACTLRADCPPDIYDAAESALKGDV